MNVDRILDRLVAPALGILTLSFLLWAGLVTG